MSKQYNIDDNDYPFDTDAFKRLFKKKQKENELRIGEYEKVLADELFVTSDTVHAWRMHKNAPSDIDKLNSLAESLGTTPSSLIKEAEREDMIVTLTDRQNEALRRIYAAVVEYLDDFLYSDGFTSYWIDLKDKGIKHEHIEEHIWQIADAKQHAVRVAADKENYDLHGFPIYDAVIDFIDEDLMDIYDGKLSYGYRFEAPVETVDGKPSGVPLEEDLAKVSIRMVEVFGLR